jgi:peptide/nickel transport system ATP-binding protein
LVGLHGPDVGTIEVRGTNLAPRLRNRSPVERRRLHLVPQSPYESLNPHHRVEHTLRRALTATGVAASHQERRIADLLGLMRLPATVAERRPDQLSGGERQRVALARALACEPEVLVCDEVTSALDPSVQAAIIELLDDLRRQLGIALVFITHDLALASSVAERILVLDDGRVAETGRTDEVLARPQHGLTVTLMEQARLMEPSEGSGDTRPRAHSPRLV